MLFYVAHVEAGAYVKGVHGTVGIPCHHPGDPFLGARTHLEPLHDV